MSRVELVTSLILAVSFITKISVSMHLLSKESRDMSSHQKDSSSIMLGSLISFFVLCAIYTYFIFFRNHNSSSLSYKMTSIWLGMSAILFISLGIVLSIEASNDYSKYADNKDKAQHILNIILTFVCGLFLGGVVFMRK